MLHWTEHLKYFSWDNIIIKTLSFSNTEASQSNNFNVLEMIYNIKVCGDIDFRM